MTSDAPSPIPGVDELLSVIGGTSMGCYNADFETDFVCYNVNQTPVVDDIVNQTICSGTSYTLPAITGTNLTGNEGYYTASGGGGTQLNVGDMISTTQTIFIYNATIGSPVCSDEESFEVTVVATPVVDDIVDQTICSGSSYTLPAITGTNLTGNEGYYTASGGGGTQLNVGDMISTTQTIFIL